MTRGSVPGNRTGNPANSSSKEGMRHHVERLVTKPVPSPPPGSLRPSELAVLRMLAQGRTNAQIAALTGLSRHTVKDYVGSIYLKLGVRRRAEVVLVALRRDLLAERP